MQTLTDMVATRHTALLDKQRRINEFRTALSVFALDLPTHYRLIFFGSAARGESRMHSDVDVIVDAPTSKDATRIGLRLEQTANSAGFCFIMLVPSGHVQHFVHCAPRLPKQPGSRCRSSRLLTTTLATVTCLQVCATAA